MAFALVKNLVILNLLLLIIFVTIKKLFIYQCVFLIMLNFNSKFYLLFLFFAIALGSIFPTYIRLELSYDLFHTRSIFLSYIYRYFISYIELLLPCSFLIFIFNFINKIPISLRILLIFLFSPTEQKPS